MSESRRERACKAAPVPTAISDELEGYQWARDTLSLIHI